MRPIRLALEGFTCFKDKQDPLELDGLPLFAISGPTGAGKSSLLDAMVFALFGKVPRMGKRGVSELISLGRERMAVTLDFRLADQAYRVTRTVHRTPTRPTQAMLEELHDELSRPLAEGVKNVDEEVRQLLGFDYDTFTRAVILPQGEFATFLKSRPRERRQILRELLRLQIFEEMRRLAGEEQRQLRARIDGDQRRLDEDYADATPAELGRRRSQASDLKKSLRRIRKQLAALRDALQALGQRRAKSQELEEKRRQAAGLEKRGTEMARSETLLEAAKRAAPVVPYFEALDGLARRSETQARLAAKEATELRRAESAHAAANEALERSRKVAQQVPELRRRTEELDRVLALLEPRTKARRRAHELTAKHSAGTEELAALAKRRGDIETRNRRLTADLEQARRRVEAVGYDPGLDARLDAVRDAAGRLVDRRASALREAGRTEELGQRLRGREREAAASAKAETAAEKLWQQADGERKTKETALREAEHKNHVAVFRRALEEGEPCPVCEQPVARRPPAADLAELDALSVAATSARRAEEAARHQLEAGRSSAAARRVEAEALGRQAAEAASRAEKLAIEVGDAAGALQAEVGSDVRDDSGDTVEERVSAAVQRVARARSNHAAATEKATAVDKELAEADRRRQRLTSDAEALERRQGELLRDAEAARTEAEAYDRQIREVTTAEDPSAERRQIAERIAVTEREERQAAAEERRRAVEREGAAERESKARRSLEELRQRIVSATEKAVAAAEDAGFDGADAVREAARPEPETRRLEEEIQGFKRQRHTLEQRVAELEADLDGVLTTAAEIKEQEKELRSVEKRESDERGRLGALEGSLGTLEQRITRRSALELQLARRRGAHKSVYQLTHDLRSDRFEAYLLEKTFDDLVRGASVRLMELSQRYTLDFAGGSFSVLDHDNASQPRSADTLSGGETFLASLSLALELSEQIQREAGAVSLDSIFIDEGFGTLDPETLEVVTSAVESLPTAGRMVGIITHIPELTRRLPFRIWVDKLPAGSRYRIEEG